MKASGEHRRGDGSRPLPSRFMDRHRFGRDRKRAGKRVQRRTTIYGGFCQIRISTRRRHLRSVEHESTQLTSLAPAGIRCQRIRTATMLWAPTILLPGGDRGQEQANSRPEPRSRNSWSTSVGVRINITLRMSLLRK